MHRFLPRALLSLPPPHPPPPPPPPFYRSAFGRKRNAVAVALAKEGKGLIRLNGQPLHLVEPAIMRVKAIEPILLLGRDRFAAVDVRVRVKGGGQSAQIYAIRQSIAKAMVAYAQKCECARW